MNGNAELLNFIYQNSQMGVDTINKLMELVEDKNFKEHLDEELKTYKEIHTKAKELLNFNGYDEKGISAVEKIRTYIMINIQTLRNKTTSHIAEMLILGSNMGIIDAIKNIRKYNQGEKDILNLMKQLQKFEENNVEKLKMFL
ncbi:hypothetical protein [Clostridium weizhouense]|uniref:DUF2383 domain-containing protein n=1 Tax=Clostridium weizhouense TaxID=2859781 RepID=A0ABS7ALL8_9CLOT|nr:hypothetical protein [Clostridium weizhouense]MBW6409527.1 hypothetical protein [Clostridium weizhouense]